MSNGRELSDYLDDIITAIADTAEFTEGMSYEMFAGVEAHGRRAKTYKKQLNGIALHTARFPNDHCSYLRSLREVPVQMLVPAF